MTETFKIRELARDSVFWVKSSKFKLKKTINIIDNKMIRYFKTEVIRVRVPILFNLISRNFNK